MIGPRGVPFVIRSAFLILAQSANGKGFWSPEFSNAVWNGIRTEWGELKKEAGLNR
jgi:hypothetical protein